MSSSCRISRKTAVLSPFSFALTRSNSSSTTRWSAFNRSIAFSSLGVSADETASTTLETMPLFAGCFRFAAVERFAVVARLFGFAVERLPADVVRFEVRPPFVDRVFELIDFARPLVLTVVRDVDVLDFEAAPSPRLVELRFADAVFALEDDVFLDAPLPEPVVLLLEAALAERDVEVDFEPDPLDPDFDVDRAEPALDVVLDVDDLDDADFDAEDEDLDLEGAEPFDLDELLLVLVAVRDLDEEALEPDLDFAVCLVAAIRCLPF